MKGRTLVVSLTVGLAALALASVSLKLRPGVVDERSYAEWEAVKVAGSPANHVLTLEKFAETSEWTAAYAVINGAEGKAVDQLDRLCYDNLTPATEGGGSPRWTLFYGPAGMPYEGYMFLDLTNNDTNLDGCIDQAEIVANVNTVMRAPMAGDEVKLLYLIVDEQERVVLDNIAVTFGGYETMFRGPGKSN